MSYLLFLFSVFLSVFSRPSFPLFTLTLYSLSLILDSQNKGCRRAFPLSHQFLQFFLGFPGRCYVAIYRMIHELLSHCFDLG